VKKIQYIKAMIITNFVSLLKLSTAKPKVIIKIHGDHLLLPGLSLINQIQSKHVLYLNIFLN